MKKLVQKIFDINPMDMSDAHRLQEFIDKKSKENWEYCGQIGLFYVFKRWEEEPSVVNGGSSSFRQSPPQYQGTYGQYNPGGMYGREYNPGYPQYPTYQSRPSQVDLRSFGNEVTNERNNE